MCPFQVDPIKPRQAPGTSPTFPAWGRPFPEARLCPQVASAVRGASSLFTWALGNLPQPLNNGSLERPFLMLQVEFSALEKLPFFEKSPAFTRGRSFFRGWFVSQLPGTKGVFGSGPRRPGVVGPHPGVAVTWRRYAGRWGRRWEPASVTRLARASCALAWVA